MSFRTVTTSAAAALIAAGSLLPMASAANAGDWHPNGRGYGSRYEARHYDGRQFNRWDGYRRHRDHTGRNIAIGAFATILGLALAAEANRAHGDRYYDERD